MLLVPEEVYTHADIAPSRVYRRHDSLVTQTTGRCAGGWRLPRRRRQHDVAVCNVGASVDVGVHRLVAVQ